MLVPFTLGLIFPLVAKQQKEFVVNRHAYGASPFSFSGQAGDFYRIYGIALLFFLPIIVVYFAFIFMIATAAARGGGQPSQVQLQMIGSMGVMLLLRRAVRNRGHVLFPVADVQPGLEPHLARRQPIRREDASARSRAHSFREFAGDAAHRRLLHPWAAVADVPIPAWIAAGRAARATSTPSSPPRSRPSAPSARRQTTSSTSIWDSVCRRRLIGPTEYLKTGNELSTALLPADTNRHESGIGDVMVPCVQCVPWALLPRS
jgi:hypothetical protein